MAVATVALAAPASAGARDRNCCFAVSVEVAGGYSVQYGSNPTHTHTGRYGAASGWATRELVSYKNGGLPDLGSKVSSYYQEFWNVNERRFGTDATQDPVPCDPIDPTGTFFIDSAASLLSLGETPAGKPAVNVGLGGPYDRIGGRLRCTYGEEGDHAGEFHHDPWTFAVPGPSAKFFRIASQGDKFRPPDYFSGGALSYSHPYEDAGQVAPHAFTGQSKVSVRINYFPRSHLDDRKKRLEQCEVIGLGTCGRRVFPFPITAQDLSGVPAANP